MLLTVDLNEGPTDYGSLLGCGTRARSGTLTWAVLVEHLGAGSALDAIGVPTRADDGDVRDSGVVLTQLCERHPGVATVVGGVPLDRRDCGAQALLRGRGSGRIGWRRRGSRHDRAACAASAFSDRSGRAVVVDERLECALDAVATPRRLANDDVLERTVVPAPAVEASRAQARRRDAIRRRRTSSAIGPTRSEPHPPNDWSDSCRHSLR